MSEESPAGKYTQLEMIRKEEQAFQKFAAMKLANDDTVSIPKIYYDITGGDHAAAAILDEILFWTLPNKKRAMTALRVRKDGVLWLAVSRAEWWERKRLSERQADRGIEVLEGLGLIVKDRFRFNGHAQTHLRVIGKVFFQLYGEALHEAYLKDAESDQELLKELTDLYEMMGWSDSPNGNLPNGDSDSPNGDSDSRNRDTNNSLQPASNQPPTNTRAPLSQEELDKANKKVDAILEQERNAKEKNASGASWPFREKIDEAQRALLDEYVRLTGQRPTKGTLMDWWAGASEWLELGAEKIDVARAYDRSRPDEKGHGGFAVTRPGSLTRTIGAVVGERRAGVQARGDHKNDRFTGPVPSPEELERLRKQAEIDFAPKESA